MWLLLTNQSASLQLRIWTHSNATAKFAYDMFFIYLLHAYVYFFSIVTPSFPSFQYNCVSILMLHLRNWREENMLRAFIWSHPSLFIKSKNGETSFNCFLPLQCWMIMIKVIWQFCDNKKLFKFVGPRLHVKLNCT